jgi:hypothetical protein
LGKKQQKFGVFVRIQTLFLKKILCAMVKKFGSSTLLAQKSGRTKNLTVSRLFLKFTNIILDNYPNSFTFAAEQPV